MAELKGAFAQKNFELEGNVRDLFIKNSEILGNIQTDIKR
jgi:hypothetical protein